MLRLEAVNLETLFCGDKLSIDTNVGTKYNIAAFNLPPVCNQGAGWLTTVWLTKVWLTTVYLYTHDRLSWDS